MRFTSFAPLALLPLAACSAIVSPDPSRLAGEDAGRPVLMLDAFVPPGVDAGTPVEPDAFVPPGVDAFTPPPLPDAFVPMACVEGPPRCEGTVRVVCADGVESREDCNGRGLACEAGSCEPRTCTPGAVSCSRDLSGVVTCNASGTSLGYTRCPMGCDPATMMCRGSTVSCPGLAEVRVGESRRVDLCASDDTTTPSPAEGCGVSSRADSGDATFALTIPSRMRVTLDLRDVDDTVGVDTVLYLRRACEDPASQVACDDDVPCTSSEVPSPCSGSVQVRQSRITVDLEPGTYYVVVDAYEYDSFECGEVELRVLAAG